MKNRIETKNRNFILILVIIFLLSFSSEHILVSASNIYSESNIHFSDETAEIVINTDNDFVRYGFPGNGSIDDPYIISNLTLNTSKMYGFVITNISSYFIIENCFIRSAHYGIFIGNIEGNHTIIRNNTFYKNPVAIEISHVPGISIINNTFNENIDFGIFIEYSPNSTISSNNFYKNGVGYTGNGLIVKSSKDSTILNNSFVNDGLAIDPSNLGNELNLINNTVNNKEIGYFLRKNNLNIDQSVYGQIIIIDCYNVSISNQQISETDVAISIYYSTNVYISNNNLKVNDKGIFLFQTYNFTIEGNSLENNSLYGLEINDCTKFNIVNNDIIKNRKGIVLFIIDGFLNSNITKNRIKENLEQGIALSSVNKVNISENVIFKNLVGLYAYYSSDVYIISNYFESNSLYAIILMDSTSEFHIYYNYFTANNYENENESQCLDDGVDNLWYNPETKKGNYWSDLYHEKEYIIDGFAESVDLYPIDLFIIDYPNLFSWKRITIFLLITVPLIGGGIYFLSRIIKGNNSYPSDKKKKSKNEEKLIYDPEKEKKDKHLSSPTATLNKQIKKQLVKSFSKWFIVGSFSVLLISSGFLAYKFSFSPDNNNSNIIVNYAQALQQSIPEAVYIEIIGNATSAIHEDLINAFIERISPYPDLAWKVTANVLKFDNEGRDYLQEVTFNLNSSVITEISQNLFESLNNTEILGYYGEKPYNDANTYNVNIKWGLRFFLENTTIIELTVLENGLVVYGKGYWVSFSEFSTNMIGALIIGPETAFDNTVQTLREIFEENIK
ncbi:MAG: right-handed parallel beta-helix repeat-containing protein [Candidatus Heimdallarchaeaceae archaeon]